MKYFSINFLKMLPSLLLLSCGAGIADMQKDLGSGYYYQSNNSVNRTVIFNVENKKYDSLIVPSTVKKFDFDENYIIIQQQNNKDMILNDLYNKMYSISLAFRRYDNLKPNEVYPMNIDIIRKNEEQAAFYRYINENISLDNTIKDQTFLQNIADSVFNHDIKDKSFVDGKINFWIIDKKKNFVFGPLDEHQYQEKAKGLAISSRLNLDSAY